MFFPAPCRSTGPRAPSPPLRLNSECLPFHPLPQSAANDTAHLLGNPAIIGAPGHLALQGGDPDDARVLAFRCIHSQGQQRLRRRCRP